MNDVLKLAQEEIESGYINAQFHEEAPLIIFNYTNKAQYDWHWTKATKQCRGLIVDQNGNYIARPFPKFFSVDQLNGKVPNEPFTVYEKLDGSLGILYHIGDEVRIATRGSFVSPQAIEATKIYQEKYRHVELDRSLTYLFEIIYPENRIVVDYGDTRDLILIAVIDTATGIEQDLPEIGFPLVKTFDGINDFEEVLALEDEGKEGFVIRFESGQRVKIKFAEYKRLHQLLTGVSSKAIWHLLSIGSDLTDIIDRVPDEFYEWVSTEENEFRRQFAEIEAKARSQMIFDKSKPRKDIAAHFKTCEYPGIMFSILDRKDYVAQIWRLLKPNA